MSKQQASVDVLEGNKTIALFMGGQVDKYSTWIYFPLPINKSHQTKNLSYHSSWDWIMPVVEKIESMEYPVSIDPTKGTAWFKVDIINVVQVEITLRDELILFIESGKNKIESVWQAVVQFIIWYNTQTKKQ